MSVRGALVRLSGSSLIAALLQLLNGILLARSLGPVGRGEYGELVFWAMTVNGMTNFAIFDAAIVRLRDDTLSWKSEVGSFAVLTAGTVLLNSAALGAILLYSEVSGTRLLPGSLWPLAAYGAIVNAVLMLSALERARLAFATLALERVLTPLSYALLLVPAVLIGPNPNLAFLLLIASNVPALALRLWRNARHLVDLRPSASRIAAISRLSLRFFSVAAVLVIVSQIDKAIVLASFDAQTAGQYFVGFSVAGAAFSLVATAIQTVMLPALVGIDAQVRSNRLERCARLALYGSLAMTVGIAVFARPLILLAFGPRFEPAVAYSVWVAIALMLMPLMSLMESANMSLARNAQAIELNLVVIAALALAWGGGLLTSVERLCVTYLVARFVAVALGFRHLAGAPFRVRIGHCLTLRREDWTELAAIGARLVRR